MQEGQEAFQAVLIVDGKAVHRVVFEELCSPCNKTVSHHLEQIAKHIKGSSPNRKRAPKTVDELVTPKARDPIDVLDFGAKKKVQGRA